MVVGLVLHLCIIICENELVPNSRKLSIRDMGSPQIYLTQVHFVVWKVHQYSNPRTVLSASFRANLSTRMICCRNYFLLHFDSDFTAFLLCVYIWNDFDCIWLDVEISHIFFLLTMFWLDFDWIFDCICSMSDFEKISILLHNASTFRSNCVAFYILCKVIPIIGFQYINRGSKEHLGPIFPTLRDLVGNSRH